MLATAAGARPSAAPFLRWVGGKQKLLPQLLPLLPSDLHERHYLEPFVGGGAVFFELHDRVKSATIGDMNADLIHAYEMVQLVPETLLSFLAQHQEAHSPAFFAQTRKSFNKRESTSIWRAAQFIYLNKVCFNGLWRVNAEGHFNVPLDKGQKASAIVDRMGIMRAHDALEGVDLVVKPFNDLVLEHLERGVPIFCYMDPPYAPASTTANFTSYTKDSFTHQDQRLVYYTARALHEAGHKVMVSNSDVPSMRELWGADPDFNITTISARRNVNSDGAKRGPVPELVIRNYR